MDIGKHDLADITSMNIILYASKKLDRVEDWHYPADQKAFLDLYLDQLVKQIILSPDTIGSWHAALPLLPKPISEFRVRASFGLRPFKHGKNLKHNLYPIWKQN